MSNWTGVYTNSDPIGTSTGSNGSNTLNDTGASWPDLVNQFVQITAGVGVGQERKIQSTLPTQITIVGNWDTTPDNTSQYKIILRLSDSDHIVGATFIYPGVYSELEDNATIYVDGNYRITIGDATEVLWNKSKETMVTFEANNRSTQGRYAFWLGILSDNIATGTVKLSYLKIRDANQGLQIEPSIAFGDGSEVHHIIFEECSSYPFAIFSNSLTEDASIHDILVINCIDNSYFNIIESAFSLTYSKFWLDGSIYLAGVTSPRTQIFKDNVVLGKISQPYTINSADKYIYIIDNYLAGLVKDIYFMFPGAGEKGNIYFSRNVSKLGREILNGSLEAEMKIYSQFNDYLANVKQTYYAIDDLVSGAETVESDNDFIIGRKLANSVNIDSTELTTSNHTPPMYNGLSSARTNAKAELNKLLECDNIQTDNLTSSSVDITFDCKNSHVGTSIDQDSSSGQKVLYVSDTSDFEIHEVVEIAFGTVREEEGAVDSIQAGVSITLKENLSYTHTAVQADDVKKQLRHLGLPFIKYGIATGEYDNETPIPDKSNWGLIYCDFETSFYGREFEWKKHTHSVSIEDLNQDTTYYAKVFCYTPLGDLMEGAEINFTTDVLSSYTDPGIDNVRDGVTYKFADDDKEGLLDIPVVDDVRFGVEYDNTTKEGLIDLPLESKVLVGTDYDNSTKTGTLEIGAKTGVVQVAVTLKNKFRVS